MAEWSIDPRNLGEVLACAGIAHLAWRAERRAATGFVTDRDDGVRFTAPRAHGLLEALQGAALEPSAQGLRLGPVELDWWRPWGLNASLRNWAGQQSAWTVHRSLGRAAGDAHPGEWRTFTAPAGGRLYVDPAGTWEALGLGFRLTAHPALRMGCRPWLELLASLGLQAFPVAGHRARGGFHYNLWRPAPMTAAAAAFAGRFCGAYALGRYHASTAKSGENTVLRAATPVAEPRCPPRQGSMPCHHPSRI